MNIEIKISKKPVVYTKAINFLEKRLVKLKNNKANELVWILEHPKIYTAGISYKNSDVVDKNIKIIKTNRGGKITIHNPGQKIVYFVLNLNKRKKNIRNLVRQIEHIIIDFLKIYGINSYADKDNIGIWVNQKKIAAIGIRVSRWIAYHGCSINISNDLNQYLKIIPCGLNNRKVTSIFKEKKIRPKNFENKLAELFIKNIYQI